jgi:acetylornithine deacetylase/succinyl-diaminopimelate desuccinylase-like protein
MAVIPSPEHRDRYVRELTSFLEIPSVSSDPAKSEAMADAARWLAERLDFANGRVVATDGHPVVLGEWLGAPGAPTILVYGHYDVQPPGPLSEWVSPPFEPTVRDGRIYARGASDDKGPVVVALETAREFLDQIGSLPLNVKFLFDGEEEIGSPSLPAFLSTHADALAADLVVSADGGMWRPSEPSITTAAKGLAAFDVEVTGPASDLHSGRHGGAVSNPNHVLAQLVAGLHAADGSIAVSGFYDGVEPLTEPERELLARVPFDEDEYRDEVGVPALHGEPGYTTLERLWARPTLEVNGLDGGGRFNVIPRAARARITCRLVAGQSPELIAAALTRDIEERTPAGARVQVTSIPGAVPAYRLPAEHEAVAAGMAALSAVYPEVEPLLVRIGGTLPAAVLFEQILGLKTLLFSFSISDERLHAPNEFFRLNRLEEGIRSWASLWVELAGRLGRSPGAVR